MTAATPSTAPKSNANSAGVPRCSLNRACARRWPGISRIRTGLARSNRESTAPTMSGNMANDWRKQRRDARKLPFGNRKNSLPQVLPRNLRASHVAKLADLAHLVNIDAKIGARADQAIGV